MKKALVEAFYLLQGLGNLVFSWFFLRDPLAGHPPGIGFTFGVLLLASSILLLLAVLALILRSIHATILAVSGWALSLSFYGTIASAAYGSLTRGHDGYSLLWLVVTVVIVVLNIVALIVLSSLTEKG